MNNLRNLIFDSLAYKIYIFINDLINESVIAQFFLDTKYIKNLWYDSFVYKALTFHIKKLMPYISKTYFRFFPCFIGVFVLTICLIPYFAWTDIYIFSGILCISIMYISYVSKSRDGYNFMLIITILLILSIIAGFVAPLSALFPLFYLESAIILFFLILFGVDVEGDLFCTLKYVYILIMILCLVSILQGVIAKKNIGISSVFESPNSFAEVLILFTPFAMSWALNNDCGKRRILYGTGILTLSFYGVMYTHLKAGFIGYSLTMILFILIADWRYLIAVLLIAPTALFSVFYKFEGIWRAQAKHGTLFENVYYVTQNFWSNNVGVSSKPILDIYTATTLSKSSEVTAITLPNVSLNPIYFNIILELGFILLFVFLWYILRLARSCLSSIFTSTKSQRMIFGAGISSLIGISVSALLQYTSFQSRNSLVYWSVIGFVAAIDKIKDNNDSAAR